MDTLRIQLFGDLDLCRGDCPLPSFATRKAKLLFSYLVLHRGRLFPRDVLVGTFWGERPERVARKCLRTGIWRVRQVLEPEGIKAGKYLISNNSAIGFNAETDYWLDIEEFERRTGAIGRRTEAVLSEGRSRDLEQAVALYRGDLLDGVYDDWCLLERERLKSMFLISLERLLRHHAMRREWDVAITYGQRLLRDDPLREHIHRDLMRFYYLSGNRPAAISQFSQCVRLLDKELGIGPMHETLDLYEAIREERLDVNKKEEPVPPPAAGDQRIPGAAPDSLARFYAAANELERARADLWQAIGQLQQERALARGKGPGRQDSDGIGV